MCNKNSILGHGTFGHDFSSVAFPRREQSFPPNDCAGLLHDRIRDVTPPLPQVTGHGDHGDHSV